MNSKPSSLKKKRVVFVAPSMASFVRLDIEILEEDFQVEILQSNWGNAKVVPFLFMGQFFQTLLKLPTTDLIIVSFGGYWSFWPALLGRLASKPVYIIVHGTDACNFPEISYGNLRKKALRFFTYFSYKWASRLLPVSESLMLTTNNYFNPKSPKKLGVMAEFPMLKTPFTVVPNGLDIEFWRAKELAERKPNTFVTVATSKQLLRKGVDLIIEVASKLPTAKFYVIGCHAPKSINLPDNVVFTGRLPQKELLHYFNTAQFYLQLSVFEGFGLSLCEAMLCGCVPVGSSVNFIPEIIGDAGLILPERNAEKLAALLTGLMALDAATLETKSQNASERIARLFPISNRRKMLRSLAS